MIQTLPLTEGHQKDYKTALMGRVECTNRAKKAHNRTEKMIQLS